ncbi:MAG: BrnT family toxin [Zoogloea sp.]|nr:BrnT family toxin [Zoogloea sp.]
MFLPALLFVTTITSMRIEFDTEKRDKTLLERGLDFACAGEVFAGATVTLEDARQNYGEVRFITVGTLDGRMVVLVWTPRGEARRIISMRKANERELAHYGPTLD